MRLSLQLLCCPHSTQMLSPTVPAPWRTPTQNVQEWTVPWCQIISTFLRHLSPIQFTLSNIILCLRPPIRMSEALCFRVVRPSVRACILLARYLTNQWTEFHRTLVDDVVECVDEPIRFWRSKGQGQGHNEVLYLTELLRPADQHPRRRLGSDDCRNW